MKVMCHRNYEYMHENMTIWHKVAYYSKSKTESGKNVNIFKSLRSRAWTNESSFFLLMRALKDQTLLHTTALILLPVAIETIFSQFLCTFYGQVLWTFITLKPRIWLFSFATNSWRSLRWSSEPACWMRKSD